MQRLALRRERDMKTLQDIFDQFAVSVWGIGNLGSAIPHATERYVAFCLPYSRESIAALPSDALMNQCKSDLAATARQIYLAITSAMSDTEWMSYDHVDRKYGLRREGISQKALSYIAGLGWIGRSSLLVNEHFGAQTRLGTIFADGSIGAVSASHSGSCGECTACVHACPANAIGRDGYNVRACRTVVSDAKGDYRTFCGLCMKACTSRVAQAAQQANAAVPSRAADL